MNDKLLNRIQWVLLAIILAGYGLVGTLYATQTAPWQAPDEPAHYNYIAQIAADGCCPVIALGDWDSDYLAELTGNRFAPELTAELNTIQYEDHQPPLYYLLGAVVHRLTGGSLIALRLTSVALGLMVILATFGVTRTLFPQRSTVALGAAALVAYIPQHAAILASVNNDALALVLVAAALWLCAIYVSHRGEDETYQRVRLVFLVATGLLTVVSGIGAVGSLSAAGFIPLLFAAVFITILTNHFDRQTSYHLMLGTVVGAAFLTKTTAYFTVGVVVAAVVLRPVVLAAASSVGRGAGIALKVAGALSGIEIPGTVREALPAEKLSKWRLGLSMLNNAREVYAPVFRRHAGKIRRGLLIVLAVSVAFGAVWWVRNVIVYDFPDILGLTAHDEVVVGQLRTAERIAEVGWATYWRDAARTTFNSFWGQLGWMALPLPANWYPLIGAGLVVAALGFPVHEVYHRRAKTPLPSARQVVIGILFALTGLAAFAQFTYYNITFYQVQGRYLFVALIPFAVGVAVGLDNWARLLIVALRGRPPSQLMPLLPPLAIAAAFGAANLWLIRFVVPVLAP